MFYKIAVFVCRIIAFIIFDFKVYNKENLDNTKGGLIVCGNHRCMIDPVMLAISTRRQIHYMGKKELFESKFWSYIFRSLGAFPVDRKGVSLSSIKSSLNILNSGGVLGIYPEGTRVKTGYDEKNAKSGIALIANKANVKILPVYLDGPYKFRGKLRLYIGKEKDYFENYTGKLNSDKYTEIGIEILKDIYKLKDEGIK
ncbi:MAG TPA: lysophospholipid acyltransferase family protein [Sedimentibacter sp.]|nr:1-acyl-sn-glycerol-3-phosphate acyltransferase [Sedimentibacter sp.]HNZ82266.1 lysophospholipid acyltransferase family protein [Sedimentibacter sp.]HOH69063.1 lysophospholipid acyltransferase family protein [Sedimentibacter sp.]HQB63416.1 lysophospholipid acyltransferase family protein [Sedimentibacter sp.]